MAFALRRRSRVARFLLLAVATYLSLDLLFRAQWTHPKLQTTLSASDLKDIRSVYIASTQWNSGNLLQDHWIPSLLQIVKDLKAANIEVFVSIYENGSWDSTKSTLDQLRQTLGNLGIANRITLDDKSHEYIIALNESNSGWLRTAYGTEMRRIPYLANVRNEALKPLHEMTVAGERFDKLIFVNDVIFSVIFPVLETMFPVHPLIRITAAGGYLDAAQHARREICSSLRTRLLEPSLEPCRRKSKRPSSTRIV